ncbi:hypothetical protein BJY52DRAFT_1330260 [Lactarius psammicola]|nr:hypothetical protein BJY52DRAFT_1330260 [Lactarius psammicola]
MMGRCFGALVVMKLSVGVRPRTDTDVQISDEELACLSAILSAESHDVEIWLRLPGTVALANMASLTFNEVDSLISDTMSSDLWDMTHQTLRILSQSLPAELNYEPRLDRTNALITIDHGQYECIVVSRLYSLFQTCTRQSPRLKEEVRTSCLRMCLKSLWNYGRVYHQLGASKPLPPHIPLALGGPEMTHRIHSEPDYSARVIGRCFEALIVNNLAACVESRTDSTVQISDKAMGYLSAILGTESHDLRLWHGRPGAVELANLVSLIFSEIDSLPSDTAPSDVLDMIQQTYSILSRTLPAELNAELMNSTDGMSPPTEPIYERRSRKCLKYLWYCARAYNQLGVSMPLPSFVLIALTNSEITGRIHTESDLAARVTGRCIWALIVYKLMDDFRPHSSSGGGVYGAELERISSVLGTRPNEFLRWPRPSAVIKLMNVISLVSGEIEPLFTSVPTPIDVLNMVQQTINIISPELILGGAFACGDLPMDQVLLLRETCSKIANAHAADLSGGQTAEILHQLRQISKQLPPVEY